MADGRSPDSYERPVRPGRGTGTFSRDFVRRGIDPHSGELIQARRKMSQSPGRWLMGGPIPEKVTSSSQSQSLPPLARPTTPEHPKEKTPPAPCGQARSIPEGDFYPSPGQPPQVASLGTRPPHRPILKGLSNPQSNARPRPAAQSKPGHRSFPSRNAPPISAPPAQVTSGVRGSVRAPLV